MKEESSAQKHNRQKKKPRQDRKTAKKTSEI